LQKCSNVKKILHIWKNAPHLRKCGTLAKMCKIKKMRGTWKSAPHLRKSGTLQKIAPHLRKCGTLGKMGHTSINAPQLEKWGILD